MPQDVRRSGSSSELWSGSFLIQIIPFDFGTWTVPPDSNRGKKQDHILDVHVAESDEKKRHDDHHDIEDSSDCLLTGFEHHARHQPAGHRSHPCQQGLGVGVFPIVEIEQPQKADQKEGGVMIERRARAAPSSPRR